MNTLQPTQFTTSFQAPKSDAVSDVGFFLGISFSFHKIETHTPL